MPDDPDELLTLAQASNEFGVKQTRLRMAAWQKRLPTRKPGHDYLVRRKDVVDFLAKSRRGRPPRPTADE
jgi:hypothetical protein